MSKETTRRNPERHRGSPHVGELEIEKPIDMDEDAAAFLQEAAEAAAAEEWASQGDDLGDEALLEIEALAAEMEAEAPVFTEDALGGADPVAAEDAEALQALLETDAREALEAVEEDAEELQALLEADALEALEAAEEDAEELQALPEVEAVEALESAEDEDATLKAQLELSEESQTAEEQALAQAEDEKDPEAAILPADIAEPDLDDELQGSIEKIAAKARKLTEDQVRHVVHSLLFVADKPLTLEHFRNATGLENARIRQALERLAGELREGVSGVILSEVAGGWQLRTAPESSDFVRRFLQVKPRRLTRAALETLAIIAYRQPVTRPEIEDIRGVDCGAVVKALLDWKLIKILGKKDEVGRPLLYGTSREFLEFFQLKDLASLPTLREFHELTEESRQIVEEELGPEAVLEISGTVAELSDPAYLEEERVRIAQSEAALADLEQALADAEEKATAVAHTINPPKDPEAVPSEPPAEES